MKAYKAIITLHSKGYLLGATRRHESSPFACEADAQSFAQQSVEVNTNRPGYADAQITYQIVSVQSSNPIPASEGI